MGGTLAWPHNNPIIFIVSNSRPVVVKDGMPDCPLSPDRLLGAVFTLDMGHELKQDRVCDELCRKLEAENKAADAAENACIDGVVPLTAEETFKTSVVTGEPGGVVLDPSSRGVPYSLLFRLFKPYNQFKIKYKGRNCLGRLITKRYSEEKACGRFWAKKMRPEGGDVNATQTWHYG